MPEFKTKEEYEKWKEERNIKRQEESRMGQIWICPECQSENDNSGLTCKCGFVADKSKFKYFRGDLTVEELNKEIHKMNTAQTEDLMLFLSRYLIKRFPNSNEANFWTEYVQKPNLKEHSKKFICTSCGGIGRPRTIIRGNFCIEIVLWLLFLVPGIIYSIWRVSTRIKVCPQCEKPSMIPIDSPVGQKLLKEFIPSKSSV